jgi:uncharacterized protein (DUF608 family)
MSYKTSMERQHKPRSGVSLGGLGCGWFEIRQDGSFYNWNIFNNRPVARGSHFREERQTVLFFLLRYQVEGERPRIRLLEIEESHDSAGLSCHEYQYIFPWIEAVDRIEFDATIPFAKLSYHAEGLPFEIEMTAWSPFIPFDAKNSSLPVANFDFNIKSIGDRPVHASLVASLRNCAGYDVQQKFWTSRPLDGTKWKGFSMGVEGMDMQLASVGSMGLLSLSEESRSYVGWGHPHQFYERFLREHDIPEHQDSTHLNYADKNGKPYAHGPCYGSIGVSRDLAPGESFEHSFCMFWDFPNRYARILGDPDKTAIYLEQNPDTPTSTAQNSYLEGHFYRNFFPDDTLLANYAAENIHSLRERTRAFHDAFYNSSLPVHVLDQINAQLNTFRTSSWHTLSGNFGIIEGLSRDKGYASLYTTDVAMYGAVMAAALFPELDRKGLLAHMEHQNKDGSVVHAINFNFRTMDPGEASGHRVDMPGQYIYMILRDGLTRSDTTFLRTVWPSVIRAFDYILRERDANRDLLPDMEGIMCSYDNFPMYGVAPYVAGQWLAGVSAMLATARILGDIAMEKRCLEVLEKGSKTIEDTTWNGVYYRLFCGDKGTDEGCLTDQLLGQWACHLSGLPTFLNPDRVHSALRAILDRNYFPDQGLRNCSWPGDGFLHDVAKDCWVDQANTCWTGVEFAFASLLLYEGMPEKAFMIIKNIDDRFRRWGIYWDHQEYGGHYYRPMSAWSVIPAALGFSICNGVATFDPKVERTNCRLFFVTTDGYGHYEEHNGNISITMHEGCLSAHTLRISKPQGSTLRTEGRLITDQDDFIEIPLPENARLTPDRPFHLNLNYTEV